MARITARQAYTRTRTKREQRKAESNRAILEARNRYIRQLSDVGLIVQNETNQMRSGPNDNTSGPSKFDHTMQTASGKRKTRISKTNVNNRKITDYFPILTKGRENIQKSPIPITRGNRLRFFQVRRQSCSSSDQVECITINSDCESDDDNNNNIKDNSVAQAQATIENTICKIEPTNINQRKLSLSKLDTSFGELNIKVIVDDDVEIVDMLPPIPLRDHPVHELDDDL